MSPPLPLLRELITKLKNSRDYKSFLKKFKEFIDKKDKTGAAVTFFLYYDLDSLNFKIGSEYDIPHNSIVLVRGFVPSKHDKKEEKSIEDYDYDWGKNL